MGVRVRAVAAATVAVLVGCGGVPSGGGGGWSDDAGVDGAVTGDPRPAAERACPTGATLRVQLWDVYAMPRTPAGEAWDGVSSGARELVCVAGAAAVTRAVRESLQGALPGSGVAFDAFVRARLQQAVAQQCGLGLGWLQDRYEGPDMFARGSLDGVARWQTPAVQDAWVAALRSTTTGAPAQWSMPCGARAEAGVAVVDEDLAVDDSVGAARFSLDALTPSQVCGGWVLLEPFEGVASTVLRMQVEGSGQNCEGLLPTRFEEITVPAEGEVPRVGVTGVNARSGG